MADAAQVQRRICMEECQAGCCRGPSYVALEAQEVPAFTAHAERLGVTINIDAYNRVGFLEHEGERCPMLDPRTNACRIYAQRPARCRAFPEAKRPGCKLSMMFAPRP